MIGVLLVDDHPVMRDLLREILDQFHDVTVIAEAASGEDAVREATRLQPAIAIVDIQLPTMSGIEACKLIRLSSPCTAVIGLTAGERGYKDLSMISAGATSVINKAEVVNGLHEAILEAVNKAASDIVPETKLRSLTSQLSPRK